MALRRSRRYKDNLGAIQSKSSRSFGKVPVITDIDSDPCVPCIKSREAQVARSKVKLLPKSGQAVRNMCLSVFAKVLAIGIDDRGGVVVNAGHLLFIDRDDHRHLVSSSDAAHQSCSRPVRNSFDQIVPVWILFRGKVGAVK